MTNRWLYFIVGGLVVVAILVALGGGFGEATRTAGTPAPAGDVNVKVETPAGGNTAPAGGAGGGASAAPAR